MAENDNQSRERIKGWGLFLIEAALAALAASGQLAPWFALGTGVVLLLVFYWPSIRLALRRDKWRPMGRMQAVQAQEEAIDKLRDAIGIRMNAWQRLLKESTEWHKRTAKERARMNQSNRDAIIKGIFARTGRIWDTYAIAQLKAASDTRDGSRMLGEALKSRMYWRRKGRDEDDLTGEDTRVVFTKLRELMDVDIERLKKPIDVGQIEEQTNELNPVFDKVRQSSAELIEAYEMVKTVCADVLRFDKKYGR